MRRRVLPHPSVLCRRATRSLFLRLANADFFGFRWSSFILDDARRWVLANTNIKGRDLNPVWSKLYFDHPEALLLDADVLEAGTSCGRYHVIAGIIIFSWQRLLVTWTPS
jgi:hypothetical protein